MKIRILFAALLVLSSLATFGLGYYFGQSREQDYGQHRTGDIIMVKNMLAVRQDLITLTLLREGKPVIPELEIVISSHLHGLDPSSIAEGSGSDYMFPRMVEDLSNYRKRFPDTRLNPARDPGVAKVLSFKR